MQPVQSASGALPHTSLQSVYHPAHHHEGVGAPFPQPGMPSGQSATAGGQNILTVLALALGGLHDSTTERFSGLDTVIHDLSTSVSEVREAAHTDTLKLAEWLEHAHERQMKATMHILERVRVLERTLGEMRGLDGDETITARMQRMDCALTELLEHVQDPQAGFMPLTRHLVERGTSPVAGPYLEHVEVGVDATAPETQCADACVLASEPSPVLADVSVNTIQRVMADASTVTTPQVADVGTCTSPQAPVRQLELGQPQRSENLIDRPGSPQSELSYIDSDPNDFVIQEDPANATSQNIEDSRSRPLLSPLSPLSPVLSQVMLKQPDAHVPSLSPSPTPPPPPPLPRRKIKQLPQSQPQAAASSTQTQNAEPRRGRRDDARQTSSPEIEIIEKPASFVDKNKKGKAKDKDKSVDGDRGKSKPGKFEKKNTKARERTWELDSDVGIVRPRKKRKTDSDLLPRKEKKPPGRPRKSLGPEVSQSQSRKGKHVTRPLSSSPPQPEPVKSSKTKDRLVADDVDCQWPDIIEGDDARNEYINCDNCDAWFHYSCVGLSADDPCLTEQDASFLCPPCKVAGRKRRGRHTTENSDAAQCARPGCPAPGSNEWFIERIIGRKPSQTQPSNDGMPKFLWLVRWLGWEAKDATWELSPNLGEHSQLVSEFEVAAELEGKDLGDPHVPTLLNEASHAGW